MRGGTADAPGFRHDVHMERDPSLIGRDGELAVVVEAIRADRPIAVIGEAGIGKTALVRAAVSATGRSIREGGGFATLSWLPYLALRRAVGLADTGDPARVAALVERAVGPDVLFVDDLQWTDDETRQVVSLLIGRIALVVAIRDGDEQTPAALEPLLTQGVAIVRLDGLAEDAAIALASRLRPDVPPVRLARVVTLAGGNPLLIEELTVHGQSSTSLERAIVGQLATLTPGDRGALELVALAGRPLAAAALGPAAERLVALGLLRASRDTVEIRHSLIAEAIVDQLDTATRLALHARLGAAVDEPAERARHLLAAGRRAEALEVARTALQSATDPRTRAMLLMIAAETSEIATEASQFRLDASILFGSMGQTEQGLALLDAPIGEDDDTKALRAAARAGPLNNEGRYDEAWAVIEAARGLRPAPGSLGLIELTVTEASLLVNRGRLADAIKLVEEVQARGGPGANGYRIAAHLAAMRLYAGQVDQLGALESAIADAFNAGDLAAAAGRAMDHYSMTLLLRGGAAAVTLALDWADRLAAQGYHTRAAELRAEACQATIWAGEITTALVRIDSMLEEPLGLQSRNRLAYHRGLALALLGHIDEAERTFAEVEPHSSDYFDSRGSALWCWAEACLWAGQPERAFEMASRSLTFTAFTDSEFILPALARAWAEVELGREPTPTPIAASFRFLDGAAPEFRGLQALARAEHDAAIAAFDEAAALWAGFHVPRELICRWAAGDAAQRSGRMEEAAARLRKVEAAAGAIGFEPLVARVRRSLRLAGERPATTASARRTDGLLTGREREILGLVERGLTNAEIARRMALGRPTVARILSNAMVKLGAESRAQAVVLASELA